MANIQASIKNLDCVVKIPCTGHRLDLSVNDIFKEKNITEKIVNGKKVFVVKDLNEEGKICTTLKTPAEKELIDNTNNCKIIVNELLSKSKKLIGSFKHSSQLQNKLKDAQNKLKYSSKIKMVQDVPSRWNSSHDMLESICINADAL